MKILKTNLNGFPYLNWLMPLTWYLISTSYILPSLVLSHCPEHAVAFVPYLYTFQTWISFINFLVYSVYLLSLTLSFCTLFGVFFSKKKNFQTSFHFKFLIFLLTHLDYKRKITIEKRKKNKTTILTGGRRLSPLLLDFPGSILRPLCIISALLFPDLSFRTPSLLHRSPNSLQLGHIPLLALYQVPEGLPNSSILLHEILECLFDGT